jgi:hypothetical protein
MTSVTKEWRPCDPTVVALTAEFSFDDFDHINFIGPRPHLKNGGMADLAFEPDSMEPMGENHRRHSSLFRFSVEGNITVFCLRDGRGIKKNQKTAHEDGEERSIDQMSSHGRLLSGRKGLIVQTNGFSITIFPLLSRSYPYF